MSLFDVIRWPIDERFLLEDLERIPNKILIKWWKEDVKLPYEKGGPPIRKAIRRDLISYLPSLKRRIKEYEQCDEVQ